MDRNRRIRSKFKQTVPTTPSTPIPAPNIVESSDFVVLSVRNTPAERRLQDVNEVTVRQCSRHESACDYPGVLGELTCCSTFLQNHDHNSILSSNQDRSIMGQDSWTSTVEGWDYGNRLGLLCNSINVDITCRVSPNIVSTYGALYLRMFFGLEDPAYTLDDMPIYFPTDGRNSNMWELGLEYGDLKVYGHRNPDQDCWFLQLQYTPFFPSDDLDLAVSSASTEGSPALLSRVIFYIPNIAAYYAVDLDYTLTALHSATVGAQNTKYCTISNYFSPKLTLQNVEVFTYVDASGAQFGSYPLQNAKAYTGSSTTPTEPLLRGGGFASNLDGNITFVALDPLGTGDRMMGTGVGERGVKEFINAGQHGFTLKYTMPNSVADDPGPLITLGIIRNDLFLNGASVLNEEQNAIAECIEQGTLFSENLPNTIDSSLWQGKAVEEGYYSDDDYNYQSGFFLLPEQSLFSLADVLQANGCYFIECNPLTENSNTRYIQFNFDALKNSDFAGTFFEEMNVGQPANYPTDSGCLYCSVTWGGHVHCFVFNPPTTDDEGYLLPNVSSTSTLLNNMTMIDPARYDHTNFRLFVDNANSIIPQDEVLVIINKGYDE